MPTVPDSYQAAAAAGLASSLIIVALANPASGRSGGPPDTGDWRLALEDQFDSADGTTWKKEFGWGQNTTIGPVKAVAENVTTANSRAVLEVTEAPDSADVEYHVGVLASKNRLTIAPPVYVEARMKTLGMHGTNTAFWAKPNSEAWPPEIDMMELPNGNVDVLETTHHIHWPRSHECGDSSSHTSLAVTEPHQSSNHSANYHIFGLEWRQHRLAYFKDGVRIGHVTDGDIMQAMNACAPFYLMFTTMVPSWLPAPENPPSAVKNTAEVDWFRKWTI